MSRAPSPLSGLLLAAASLVVFPLALEGGVRFLYCLAVEKRLSLAPREPASLFVRDERLLYRQRAGFDGPWGRSHPVHVRINSLGLRGPERALDRAPGTIRVLVLGDSQTWGFDVEEDEAYPQALEGLLNAARVPGGARYEVVNAAVPGYSSYHGLVWLGEHLDRFHPDVVTVAFNFNDRLLADERPSDFSLVRATPGRYASAWRWSLLERSFLIRKGRALVARLRARAATPGGERYLERKRELLGDWPRLAAVVTPEERRDHLRRIAARCRSQGVRLVFIGLPEHPSLAAPLDSATARLSAGDAPGAERALEPYFAAPDSALRWTYSDYDVLANALAAQAHPGMEPSWPHLRAPANLVLATASDYSRVAERVADEEDLVFVDAAAALSARPEVFLDECHFDGRGHALVAELLAPAILRAAAAPAPR